MADDKKTLEDLKDVAVEAATDAEAPVVDAAIEYVQKIDAQGRAYATGKRKDAIARVWIKPGNGTITVILRHEPDKDASGVSNGDITNAGGETDIEVVFNVEVM